MVRNIRLERINFLAIIIVFVFALMFTLLVIYEEYRDFDVEAQQLRSAYLQQQKEAIREGSERALRYVAYEYDKWHGRMDDATLQESVIDAINTLYDRGDGSSYIFIYRLDGTNISDPNRPEFRGRNMMALKDLNGVPILPSLIAAAREGAYVEYVWEKPTTKRLSPKIAFAAIFEPWQWLVGTGVYVDDIDALIAEKRLQMRDRLIKYIMEILTLSAILFAFALSGMKLINKVIRDEIATFSDFFKTAASRYIVIDKRQIRIREFHTLVGYVNAMVDAIHSKNRELTLLNASLEQKVRDKTARLQREKAFSEQLVRSQDAFIKQSIHEINTPLAVIMTQIDLYKHLHGEDRHLSHIEAAAKMIHTIFDDLRYMVRKERIDYPKALLDLSGFLRERIAFFEGIAVANRLQLQNTIAEGVQVCMNEEELRRVVDNNLSNAIKYAYPDSAVDVVLRLEAGEPLLAFRTRSRTIDNPEKVFEPFYREDDRHAGFGLGLHLVKAICDKYGIRTEIASAAGETVFTYRFGEGRCDEDPAA